MSMSNVEVKAGQVWVRRIRPDENIGQRRILRVREDGYVYWERPGSTLKSSCSRQQWLHYARGAMLQNDPIPALLAAARNAAKRLRELSGPCDCGGTLDCVYSTCGLADAVSLEAALTAYEQQQ